MGTKMKYEVVTSLRTPSAIEAMRILEANVQNALAMGGQLVGGVSVTYGADCVGGQPGYDAFQAVMMPGD